MLSRSHLLTGSPAASPTGCNKSHNVQTYSPQPQPLPLLPTLPQSVPTSTLSSLKTVPPLSPLEKYVDAATQYSPFGPMSPTTGVQPVARRFGQQLDLPATPRLEATAAKELKRLHDAAAQSSSPSAKPSIPGSFDPIVTAALTRNHLAAGKLPKYGAPLFKILPRRY